MKKSRRTQWLWSLVTVAGSAGYIWGWFRFHWDSASGLLTILLGGITALVALIYGMLKPSQHEHVTKVILGCAAAVATYLAVCFLYYAWTERDRLLDLSLFLLFALYTLLALGVAVFAWVCFWRYKWR